MVGLSLDGIRKRWCTVHLGVRDILDVDNDYWLLTLVQKCEIPGSNGRNDNR